MVFVCRVSVPGALLADIHSAQSAADSPLLGFSCQHGKQAGGRPSGQANWQAGKQAANAQPAG